MAVKVFPTPPLWLATAMVITSMIARTSEPFAAITGRVNIIFLDPLWVAEATQRLRILGPIPPRHTLTVVGIQLMRSTTVG
jgi:hypothetical protein